MPTINLNGSESIIVSSDIIHIGNPITGLRLKFETPDQQEKFIGELGKAVREHADVLASIRDLEALRAGGELRLSKVS